MVQITVELVRKRSEHNEGEIGTLEELTLHQEDIEKIEHIQSWCKHLQILYFQSNLIPKIENLHKLKKLEYLNLALNNIERIENLEGCESLNKLDLTLNFIGELTGVKSLIRNRNLESLYLTGNPCSYYTSYRQYVIAALPQLKLLDGVEISKSDRIIAVQVYSQLEDGILIEQGNYKDQRSAQKAKSGGCRLKEVDDETPVDDEFWSEMSDHSPETRVQLAMHSRRQQRTCTTKPPAKRAPKRQFANDGRPLNVNEPKLPFLLTDDEETNAFLLDIAVQKHLDTSFLDVDIQPMYAKVLVKGKLFQVVFAEEVNTNSSLVQRSLITGHLILTMPKVNGVVTPLRELKKSDPVTSAASSGPRREFLEIGSNMDFSKIVERNQVQSFAKKGDDVRGPNEHVHEKLPPPGFSDDPGVPPLE